MLYHATVMRADTLVADIRAASRQMVRELGMLDGRIECLGLSCSQAHALMEIERQGPLTSIELARELNLDRSTVSRTVAKLVRDGYLVADPGADRRTKPLVLTDGGKAKLRQVHAHADRQVESALRLLAPDDQAAVRRGLVRYAKALAQARAQEGAAIRPIRKNDDQDLERIIRSVLTSFGLTGPGTAAADPEVGAMSASYTGGKSQYFVLERERRVLGGAGFGPLAGGEEGVCELRKMYLHPDARGAGLGRRLLEKVLGEARRAGYRRCYLETIPSMTVAHNLYESIGFRRLESPMGNTGHCACDVWYARDL